MPTAAYHVRHMNITTAVLLCAFIDVLVQVMQVRTLSADEVINTCHGITVMPSVEMNFVQTLLNRSLLLLCFIVWTCDSQRRQGKVRRKIGKSLQTGIDEIADSPFSYSLTVILLSKQGVKSQTSFTTGRRSGVHYVVEGPCAFY